MKSKLNSAFLSIRVSLRKSLAKLLATQDDIDDVIQETYLRAVASNSSKEIRDPEGYLFRISRNIALNEKARIYRQLEISLPVEEIDALTVLMNESTLEHVTEQKQRFADFCLAIGDLPLQCRRVFVLKKVYGYSQQEIADKLGISLSTVESHIAKGMLRVSARLEAKTTSRGDHNAKAR